MLEIIIGGKAQGKLAYALDQEKYKPEMVCDGENLALDAVLTLPVLNQFHLYLRKALQEEKDIPTLLEHLFSKQQDICLICDEVGSGVVPMDAFERNYREQVGRTMCMLTQKADKVVRVQCGIGTVIKEK